MNCKIEKFECISFDVFDTLVSRCVTSPSTIFEWTEKIYNQANRIHIKEFRKKRMIAERRARLKGKEEIIFDDIYNEMLLFFSEDVCNRCKEIEIELEIKCSIPRENVKRIFLRALSLKKRVFVISDMYMSSKVIEEILRKCGYPSGYTLYVSSEYNKTKRIGTLFDYVLKKEKINKDELLHIGDNIRGDYIIPRNKGIMAYHIKNYKNKHIKNHLNILESNQLLKECLKNFQIKGFWDNEVYSYFGYNCLGPLVYGYIKWIYAEISNTKATQIYFFSREGKYLKKIFELLYPEKYTTYYFYVSRRALFTASLWINPEFENVLTGMYFPIEFTVSWFLDKLGLKAEDYEKVIEKYGFKATDIINRRELIKYKVIYNELKHVIVEKSINAFAAFKCYLNKFNIERNIAIVDIGWNGNMQRCLLELLNQCDINTNVIGYYLGVNPKTKNTCLMKGYLYDKKRNTYLYKKMKYINIILELLFIAPHGTLKRYSINKENYLDKEEFEYQGTETLKDIIRLQKNAIKFIEEFNEIGELLSNDALTYAAPLMNVLLRPKKELIHAFGKLKVWDDKWELLIVDRDIREYILKPKQLYIDFRDSAWKNGFLKKLFKISLPYEKGIYFLDYIVNK